MKKTNRVYPCEMTVLYTVGRAAWAACHENLAAFAAFKAKYTEQYITDALTAIDEAEKIKSSESRDANQKEDRIKLQESAKQVRINWQLLKRYIIEAFPSAMQQTRLQAAGSAYYISATANRWTSVTNLILAGNSFIHDNMATLVTNGHMPAAFAAKCTTDGDRFMQLATAMSDTVAKNRMTTQDKVDANNAIYRTLIDMCSDAQRMFADNAALRNQFNFTYLASKASGNGIGSIRGLVSSSFNGKGVPDVTITAIADNYSAITNNKGRYNITRVAAGTYTFVFEKPGYDSITLDVVVKPGTRATFDVVLTAQQVALKAA